jgi:hypothetical protein
MINYSSPEKIKKMKKLLFSCFCGGLFYIFSCYHSIAQENAFHPSPRTASSSTSAVRVNAKLSKAFSKQFENAYDVSWKEINDKFLVKFMQDGLQSQALLTKYGDLIYQFSYGTEKDLPADVRKLVKSHYYDQSITIVHKVNQDGRTIYVITLEDDNEIIKVNVENMEMAEIQRINRIK